MQIPPRPYPATRLRLPANGPAAGFSPGGRACVQIILTLDHWEEAPAVLQSAPRFEEVLVQRLRRKLGATHHLDDHHRGHRRRDREVDSSWSERAVRVRYDRRPRHRWAFAGTYLGQLIGWYGPNDTAGWTMSVVGAIIVLA